MTEETNDTPNEGGGPAASPSTGSADESSAGDAALLPEKQLLKNLGRSRKRILWSGIGLAVLGIVALLFPISSSVVTSAVIGWLLLFAGIIGFFFSFTFHGAGPFFGAFLTSLLTIAAGVFLLRYPEIALVMLTVFVAAVFLVDGAFTIGAAFELKPAKGWGWLLFSAIISVLAGILIVAGLPASSLLVLGILVGVRFLSGGISSIMLARSLPKPA